MFTTQLYRERRTLVIAGVLLGILILLGLLAKGPDLQANAMVFGLPKPARQALLDGAGKTSLQSNAPVDVLSAEQAPLSVSLADAALEEGAHLLKYN